MTTKRTYTPKNIRKGLTLAAVVEHFRRYDRGYNLPQKWEITIHTFGLGRDACGNKIAHYDCYIVDGAYNRVYVVRSGVRREQVGYSGVNEAALYALKQLGYGIDITGHGGQDYQKKAKYPIINMPRVSEFIALAPSITNQTDDENNYPQKEK